MHEDLLGYLLGALDPDEMRRVEAMLAEDPVARAELEQIEEMLRPLDEARAAEADVEALEPPPRDLVARTLASLPPIPAESSSDGAADGSSSLDRLPTVVLSDSSAGESSSKMRPLDWMASIVAVVVLFSLTIPSILEGRFVARKTACQDNLRELGVSMTQFVNRNAQSRLPSVAAQGHRAFAGVYAPRLRDAGLELGSSRTACPSVDPNQFGSPHLAHGTRLAAGARLPEGSVTWVAADEGDSEHDAAPEPVEVITLRMLDSLAGEIEFLSQRVPMGRATIAELQTAVDRLRWMQETAGGHYAYTLGVRDGQHLSSPRYQGRSSFAVMSDAAVSWPNLSTGLSADSPSRQFVTSHGGRGINVLYEDGRTGFVTSESLLRIPDHPLLNNAGLVEAGLNIDDAVLAPSWRAPFLGSAQR